MPVTEFDCPKQCPGHEVRISDVKLHALWAIYQIIRFLLTN